MQQGYAGIGEFVSVIFEPVDSKLDCEDINDTKSVDEHIDGGVGSSRAGGGVIAGISIFC